MIGRLAFRQQLKMNGNALSKKLVLDRIAIEIDDVYLRLDAWVLSMKFGILLLLTVAPALPGQDASLQLGRVAGLHRC